MTGPAFCSHCGSPDLHRQQATIGSRLVDVVTCGDCEAWTVPTTTEEIVMSDKNDKPPRPVSHETLRGWAAVRAANEQVAAAQRALAIEASVAVTDAVRSCDGWESTGYGATVGSVWRDLVGITCHSAAWYAEIFYDGEAECLGPFSTPLDAAKAAAASGLDIGDFLTAHPWLAPQT